MIETASCPVCNSALQTLLFHSRDFLLTHEDFSIVKCDACSIVYTSPRICESSIGDYYALAYAFNTERKSNKLFNCIKSRIKIIYSDDDQKIVNFLRKKGVRTVLEVGSGNGSLLECLHDNGFEVVGVEIDEACVKSIIKKGILCYHGTIENVRAKLGVYDVVIMRQVLEHLYSPKDSLKIIHSILSDYGLLYLSVPNIASIEARLFGRYWRGLDLPRHITHFSRGTLNSLLKESGYIIEKMNNMYFPSSFVESIGFFLFKRKMPLKLYYLLYYFWKILAPIHTNLLGSGVMTILAKKK
jgi:SAM-dependent methyltransferase